MKKVLFSIAAFVFGLFVFSSKASALTKYNVGTVEDYFNKIEEIDGHSNEEFEITLTSDIEVTSSSQVKLNNTIRKGNTLTLLGNGHTFKSNNDEGKLNVSNGTIILGKDDGTDTLILEGDGDNTTSASMPLVNVTNGTLKMYDGVTLQKNYGGVGSLAGGGVVLNANARFVMEGGIIQDNKCNGSGIAGAIILNEPTSEFVMNDGTIQYNEALTYGGAIYQAAGSMILNKGKFLGNTTNTDSDSYGGAIIIGDGIAEIYDVIFEGNASKYGGAVVTVVDIFIDGATFKTNDAYYGGAFMNWGGTNVVVKNTTFDGNTGAAGGAVMNYPGSVMRSENNTYINNEGSNGGAIYAMTSFTSVNDTIKNNAAGLGGGVYLANGEADFSTTDVYNNKATTAGNDYYIRSGMTSVSIKDASTMTGTATFGNTTVKLGNWFRDESGNRYSVDSPTEVVAYTAVAPGTNFYLTAAGDPVYVAKFNTNGGSEIADQNIDQNGKVTEPLDPTKNGYRFLGWYSNEELTNEYNFNTEVTSNLTLYAKWEQIIYDIIEGDGQETKQSELDNMEFTINAEFSLFGTVYVDDNLVTAENYDAHTGSNVVILKQAYLSALIVGNHTLKVVFNDGGVATGAFTILGNDPEPDPAQTPDEPSDVTPSEKIINPTTGDNIMLYIAIMGLSIVGLGTVIYKKRFN